MDSRLPECPATEIIHPKEYFVQFTGDYARLKSMDYSFQKLYAANYQQWNKDDIRIWRKGRRVTHDELGSRFPAVFYQLVKIGINNLPFEPYPLSPDIYRMQLYIHKETFECTPDPARYQQARMRMYESFDRIKEEKARGIEPTSKLEVEDWVEIVITPEWVELLRELVDKNWITLEKRAV